MIFDFWKDNRLDQHYQLSQEDMIREFNEWLNGDGILALFNHYRTERMLGKFLSEHLKSVMDHDQEDDLLELIYEKFTRTDYFWRRVREEDAA